MAEFEAAFAKYVKWIVDGAPEGEKEKRTTMLKAFREFLEDNDIPRQGKAHQQLVDKMEEFAKGVGKNGPR